MRLHNPFETHDRQCQDRVRKCEAFGCEKKATKKFYDHWLCEDHFICITNDIHPIRLKEAGR